MKCVIDFYTGEEQRIYNEQIRGRSRARRRGENEVSLEEADNRGNKRLPGYITTTRRGRGSIKIHEQHRKRDREGTGPSRRGGPALTWTRSGVEAGLRAAWTSLRVTWAETAAAGTRRRVALLPRRPAARLPRHRTPAIVAIFQTLLSRSLQSAPGAAGTRVHARAFSSLFFSEGQSR